MKKVLLALIVGYSTITLAQNVVAPTDLESKELAVLKAQNETLMAQLQNIDTQIQALNILKQLTTEHQQQKFTQFLGKAEEIKKLHTEDWGKPDKTNFNPTLGESGTFTVPVPEPKKDEKKDDKKPEPKK